MPVIIANDNKMYDLSEFFPKPKIDGPIFFHQTLHNKLWMEIEKWFITCHEQGAAISIWMLKDYQQKVATRLAAEANVEIPWGFNFACHTANLMSYLMNPARQSEDMCKYCPLFPAPCVGQKSAYWTLNKNINNYKYGLSAIRSIRARKVNPKFNGVVD